MSCGSSQKSEALRANHATVYYLLGFKQGREISRTPHTTQLFFLSLTNIDVERYKVNRINSD